MDFGLSEEQELLRAEVRKFLDARCPLEQVRKVMETGPGYAPELWRELAELGWLGLTIPEAHGGAGLTWVDLVVLLHETGRSLFPSPLVSTTLAAAAILDSGTRRAEGALAAEPGRRDADRDAGAARGERRARADRHRAAGQARRRRVRADGREEVRRRRGRREPVRGRVPHAARARRTWRSASSTRARPACSATAFATIDATKRLGTLALENARVPKSALLGKPGAGLARDREALRPRRRRGHRREPRRRRGRARRSPCSTRRTASSSARRSASTRA